MFGSLGLRSFFSGSLKRSSELSVVPSKPLFNQVAGVLESTQISSTNSKHDLIFPFQIKGNEAQIIEITLAPKEGVRATVGALVYMDDQVEMETTTGGGMMKSFKRWITGDNFFISDFVNNTNEEKTVVFGPAHPTKLVPILLSEHGGSLVAQKGAFLCGARNTEIELFTTTSFKTGFFGGEGFILQRLSGEGLVVLEGGGALICRDLAEGEVLRASGGNLVAFEETVNFSVDMVKGGKNIIFGGEGLFLTRLEGPGKVWLQGMPFSKLAESIGRVVGGRGGGGMILPMGGLGGGGSEAGEQEGLENSDGEDLAENDGGIEAPVKPASGSGGWFSSLFGDDDDVEE